MSPGHGLMLRPETVEPALLTSSVTVPGESMWQAGTRPHSRFRLPSYVTYRHRRHVLGGCKAVWLMQARCLSA